MQLNISTLLCNHERFLYPKTMWKRRIVNLWNLQTILRMLAFNETLHDRKLWKDKFAIFQLKEITEIPVFKSLDGA